MSRKRTPNDEIIYDGKTARQLQRALRSYQRRAEKLEMKIKKTDDLSPENGLARQELAGVRARILELKHVLGLKAE